MRVDATNQPESMSETIKHLRAELSQLREELKKFHSFIPVCDDVETLKISVGRLAAKVSDLLAENERLKGEERYLQQTLKVLEDQVAAYDKLEKEFDEVMDLKDTALDRLEWAGDDDTFDRCFACDVHKSKQHKPDCWWQAARKA